MTKEEQRAYNKTYRLANRERIDARKKAYYQTNREWINAHNRKYYQSHCENAKAYSKAYRQAHREQMKAYQKSYYQANKEHLDNTNKEYQQIHSERCKAYREEYYRSNRATILARAKAHYQSHRKQRKVYLTIYRQSHREKLEARRRNRRHTDIHYKLSDTLRSRLYSALKGNAKAGSAVRDLGCSIPEFKAYIAAKFQPEMSWDNYSKWHLDHIIPLTTFNLADRTQFLAACHYTNYQPLWAEDNLSKQDQCSPIDRFFLFPK